MIKLTERQRAKIRRMNAPSLLYAARLVLKQEKRLKAKVKTYGSVRKAESFFILPYDEEEVDENLKLEYY